MQLVKLDAIDSTNAFLKRTLQGGEPEDWTVVHAKEQTKGRGQQGTTWVSEPGKNLTFSVFKKFNHFYASDHFYLNLIVCLAIHRTLKNFQIPNLSIKWPNDIMSGNSKICGILIETIMTGALLKSAIIGVGLNVDQVNFTGLTRVSSLKLLTGLPFDQNQILQKIVGNLTLGFERVKNDGFKTLRENYIKNLFMKNRSSFFRLADGTEVKGRIRGVSKNGKLIVEFDEKRMKEFELKEVSLLY